MPGESVSVLMTCMGSPMAVEIMEALRRTRDVQVRVVAVDMDPAAVGQRHADAFYRVPAGDDPQYVSRIVEICRKEGVSVVLTGSDEEALALAPHAEALRRDGIACMVPRPDLVGPFSDKAAMFRLLADHGVELPRYAEVATLAELRDAARAFGYPKSPFVVKPAKARGGRGVWLVHPEGSSLEHLVKGLAVDTIPLETLTTAIERAGWMPPLVVMDWFEGDVFDVDVLAEHGRTRYLVARRRFHPRTTPFRGCILERHDGVLALAAAIQEALQLHGLYDIDIVLQDDRPRLLEVNPRQSASVIATVAAGLNLLEFLVYLALGREIPTVEIPYGKVVKPSVRTTCWDRGS